MVSGSRETSAALGLASVLGWERATSAAARVAVFVKKDQMTCAALGVLPWGHGKPWPPVFHTANPTLAPLEQSAHVVSVIALCGVSADDPLHPSTARSAAT